MIYLDYSATTPLNLDVLDTYIKTSKDFIGNPNSIHSLGVKSLDLMNSATKQISDIFNVMDSEIIYTSGATESNNLALIGACMANYKNGKHIIVSKLEHPSIYAICDYLKNMGFEISYVNNDQEGLIDFDDLKNLIREDTILVSICAVNSEVGIRQPLKMLRQIIKKENERTIFHSDITQALGKTPVNFFDFDMASASCHKIYGPKGIGFLYKNNQVKMSTLIKGSGKHNQMRPGTPPLPLIVSMAKAIRIAVNDLDSREKYITLLNEKIIKKLSQMPDIKLNKTKYSIPHIINISLENVKAESLIHALEKHEIYVGSNTACASNEISNSVMAIYNDIERSKSTIRISLSHLTQSEDINRFLSVFELEYNNLNNLISGGNNIGKDNIN